MHFYKYHGAGNDFILVDNRKIVIPEEKLSLAAVNLCHRNFGIGADGLVLIENSENADIKFRIFNPDGSEAEMCGNGIRCFAKHVYDFGIVTIPEIKVETLAGVLSVNVVESGEVSHIKVDMGKPRLDRRNIPAAGEGKIIRERLDNGIDISAVNTGVPHVVTFAKNIDSIDVCGIGRKIRYNKIFPEGINVNFLEKTGENKFKIRTYERGVENETLACGTGITASAVIAYLLGEARGERIEVDAKGGRVFVELEVDGKEVKKAYMIGPAEMVFDGNIVESKFLMEKKSITTH